MRKFILRRHPQSAIRWWYEKRDNIDFDPPYQRESGIWPPKNKSFLIDTILNGYDIPKFYVVDFSMGQSTLNKKNKLYAIIDGKQRMEAIIDFYLDRLKIGEKSSREFVYEKNPGLELSGLKYSDLLTKHPGIARAFDDFKIDVISVWSDNEDPIRSLFVRLNTQVPVTGAEKRHALRGVVMDQTRSLALHPFFVGNVSFNKKRLAHMDAALKLLWIEYNTDLVDTKRNDLDKFADAGLNPKFNTSKCEHVASQVRNILDRMASIFQQKDALLGSVGVIPLFYWFIKRVPKKDDKGIRPFLVAFEKQRLLNMKKSKEGKPGIDQELLGFSQDRRSHNDSQSMQRMLAILVRRLGQGTS